MDAGSSGLINKLEINFIIKVAGQTERKLKLGIHCLHSQRIVVVKVGGRRRELDGGGKYSFAR